MNMAKDNFKFHKEEESEIPSYEYFRVSGAGDVQISSKPTAICGESAGFSIGVSWGRYGYTGGVMGIEEAKRLANHILSECAKVTKTEKQLLDESYKEYN